jgi:pimeloyl-ACP methyl ester carboxylesterase
MPTTSWAWRKLGREGQKVRGGRYEVIEGASHWISLDTPDRLNALLLDWLQGAAQLDD